MTKRQTVLILGASGRFGGNAAAAFESAGWAVRRFDRRSGDLEQAAQGADVIVNGWNPAYPQWAGQVPNLHAQVCRAAANSGATVIVPGNVYVFGATTKGPWSDTTPHLATNPLGRIRIAMEQGYRDSGVRTIILRAGDFLDTRGSGNWFDQIMIKHLKRGDFSYPGNPDIDHAWAFLPDLCRAAVGLAEMRRDLPAFCDVAFPGYCASGRQVAAALDGFMTAEVTLKQMSWLPLRLAAPVWPMGRCLLEMQYLWNTPHRLDGALFDRLLPGFRTTPMAEALEMSVQGAGVATRSTQTSRWRLAASASS